MIKGENKKLALRLPGFPRVPAVFVMRLRLRAPLSQTLHITLYWPRYRERDVTQIVETGLRIPGVTEDDHYWLYYHDHECALSLCARYDCHIVVITSPLKTQPWTRSQHLQANHSQTNVTLSKQWHEGVMTAAYSLNIWSEQQIFLRKNFQFFAVRDQMADKKKSRTDQYLDSYHFSNKAGSRARAATLPCARSGHFQQSEFF